MTFFQFALRKDLSCDELADDYDKADDDDLDLDVKAKLDNDADHIGEVKQDGRSSLGSLESSYRKPSRVTQLFLVADKNFPRTLFVMAIVQAISWGPFYFLILISPILTVQLPREAFLLSVWLGYCQSVITPFLIYLLSDWVHEELDKLVNFFVKLCTGEQTSRQVANEVKLSTYSKQVVKV